MILNMIETAVLHLEKIQLTWETSKVYISFIKSNHCTKSVEIKSFLCSVFSSIKYK